MTIYMLVTMSQACQTMVYTSNRNKVMLRTLYTLYTKCAILYDFTCN